VPRHGGAGRRLAREALGAAPPALTSLARQFGGRLPEELVRHVVDGRRQVDLHGPREMPVWGREYAGEDLSAARIEALIAYLKAIQE
jgi:hypothetical protein